ncbi:NAD(P)H-dependent oxidoreductase [Citrobacter freundii]|jgi:modulator of drug activity B|uniref:NAD(P)H-dependent oxidoreductase n=2 Tax=Enterobacteriaceae TaxID=543 RepID=A0AB35PWH3_9ENTR|nr:MULTISPECIES: NAD(P)H-dependent oxidoreductase [Enterobacteriaceae]HCM9315525.1 NAD(P)H-dependent oxidoreductase [Enterobacter hormaechei subsp. steigerwaltii]EGT0635610.1 NAD(P)H-dependent oxidoreductase [Citrobacter freundii]EHN8827191.1 NAD(P)H-dependent oxidoreductase [Enterobacter bugandensis]EHN8848290.1 NAD(P)H-dependent oxidoreductase [Enterobacter bugandensis]EHN8904921.1 NAD(P)H-dependent oxidoreductase [Enterobacter asburiae]
MSNILIINGAKSFNFARGELNELYVNTANEVLSHLGHTISVTRADSNFDPQNEISKILNSDILIYQMPGWWMGEPWTVKKWIDEVFTEGHGSLYESDGRTRSDGSKKYGSGGLLQNKKYMLSLTWNAPLEAFNDPEQFFEGVGVDGLYLHLHKANQFLGMRSLPTFITNDVVKSPDVENEIRRFSDHLIATFS